MLRKLLSEGVLIVHYMGKKVQGHLHVKLQERHSMKLPVNRFCAGWQWEKLWRWRPLTVISLVAA